MFTVTSSQNGYLVLIWRPLFPPLCQHTWSLLPAANEYMVLIWRPLFPTLCQHTWSLLPAANGYLVLIWRPLFPHCVNTHARCYQQPTDTWSSFGGRYFPPVSTHMLVVTSSKRIHGPRLSAVICSPVSTHMEMFTIKDQS